MSEIKCVVCKQPIQKGYEIQTPSGPAHLGPCAHYVDSLPLSESTQLLEETELLL